MTHDPLCPQGPPDNPWCMCALIARVRADERERIAQQRSAQWCPTCPAWTHCPGQHALGGTE